MKHRIDIECLRAVAVLAVIAFHMLPGIAPGGFIGVDVFFVISGFLMTKIIAEGAAAGRFSVLAFYGSRIRRIYPALLFCVFFFFVLGFYSYIYLDSFKELVRSARSAVFGTANLYFYKHTNYFDLDAASQIFLHTWSLGVELQFYVLYPLVLLGCKRFFKMKFERTIVVLLVLSFLASCYFVLTDQKGAFYLLPSRAWEFMAGGWLAVRGGAASGRKNALPWIGFALIVLFSLYYDKLPVQRFPGPLALLPCVAAVLFIAAGGQGTSENGAARGLLFNPLFSFVGKLSYSLYLWHWPILVLYRSVSGGGFGIFDATLSLLLIFVCSYFSWRFVEYPFRQRLARLGRVRQLACLAGGLAILPLMAIALRNADPVLFEAQRSYLAGAKDLSPLKHRSLLGDPSRPVSFLLLGDSHARALGACFSKLAESRGTAGRLFTLDSPLLNARKDKRDGRKKPPGMNEALLGGEQYEAVYIAMRWSVYVKGNLPSETFELAPPEGYIDYSGPAGEYSGLEALSHGLEDTVEFLLKRGTRKVYLVLPVPEQYYQIPQSAGRLAMVYPDDALINAKLGLPVEDYLKRQDDVLRMLRETAERHPDVVLLDPAPVLCGGDRFDVVRNGRSLYYDDDHLSQYGSECLAPLFFLKP